MILTPNTYISLTAAIVYATNDVTIPVNSVAQISFLSNALLWTFDIGDIKSNEMKSLH